MGIRQGDPGWVDDLDFGFPRDECRDADVVERGFQRDVVRTELPQCHHRIQGISLLCGMPQVLGETRRMDVEAGGYRNLIAQPGCMAKTSRLAAINPIVNGVERQDRVRQHGRLYAQVPPPDLSVRRGELIGTKLQATENSAVPNTPIQQHLSAFDERLVLKRDPLITAVLYQQGSRNVARSPGMMARSDRSLDFEVRNQFELAVKLPRSSMSLASVPPEVEEKICIVLAITPEVVMPA